MRVKHDKNSWLALYIKISFKGFKAVFFIKKGFTGQSSLKLSSLGVSFSSGFVFDFLGR